MILSRQDGVIAATPQDAQNAEAAGYVRCATSRDSRRGGIPCDFYISPESQSAVEQKGGGYYTCPVCQQSHDLMHELPWHGVPENEVSPQVQEQWSAGGGTRIGLGMDEQGEIGEQIVRGLGHLGEYGPIVWWHQGGATANAPLDGATKDWGIEVKTLGYDTAHHRYVPGRPKEKAEKNQMAEQMGKLGVVGVLVLLDYRRSVADVYVQGHSLTEGGVKAFRSMSKGTQHLVAEVPFKNPLMDPHSYAPAVDKQDMPF